MKSVYNTIFLIIKYIENFIGTTTCGFIVTVNILDWATGKGLNSCDLILVASAISTTIFQCALAGITYIAEASSGVNDTDYRIAVLFALQIWTGSTSNWLTASLCVFYCVKIVDCNQPFFFWIKLRISKMVPWLILGSAVGSFLLIMTPSWILYMQLSKNATINCTVLCILSGSEMKSSIPYNVASVLGFCLPITFCIASITAILASLYRHTRRMKEKASGFSQPRLEAHFGAARMLGCLLLVYALLLMAGGVQLISYNNWFSFVLEIAYNTSPPAQSVILILGNSKLRNTIRNLCSLCRK